MNSASASVSPLSVTVSAATGQGAPTATLQVTVSGAQPGSTVYLSSSFSHNGISDVSGPSGTPVSVSISFRSPSSLGPGVYADTVTLETCYDKACSQQLANSPQTVQVQYTVTGSRPMLTSLSPATAATSGPPFTLTVNGTNFGNHSTVQWNGTQRNTTYISPTQLTAQITAADIAGSGTAAVSVNDVTNGLSSSLGFMIQPGQLTLTGISPTAITVGGTGFALTVLGDRLQ